MGNNPSTTHRRVQPSFFSSFKYNRLLNSSCSENQQPLLVNNQDENVEQLKREAEANRKKNESLEKRKARPEKDMRECKAAITPKKEPTTIMDPEVAAMEKFMRECKATVTPKKEPTSNMEIKVATLERQVAQLKSTISFLWTKLKSTTSRLESATSQPVIPVLSGTESEITHLKKIVESLELRLMTVELDNSARKKHDKEIAAQQIAADWEKQLFEPAPIHQTMRTTSACKQEPDYLVTSMEQEFGDTGNDWTQDLIGCLVILIFLVAILIGLNM